METKKLCLECGVEISGRSDRKFCCEECRVSYHNRKYGMQRKRINEINNILMRNYRILKDILDDGIQKCTTSYLFKKGFNFDYITSLADNEEPGSTFLMGCYEFRYSIDEKGVVSITVSSNVD